MISSEGISEFNDSPMSRKLTSIEGSMPELADTTTELEDRIIKYLDQLNIKQTDPTASQKAHEAEQKNKVASQNKIGNSPSSLLLRRQSILKL